MTTLSIVRHIAQNRSSRHGTVTLHLLKFHLTLPNKLGHFGKNVNLHIRLFRKEDISSRAANVVGLNESFSFFRETLQNHL